MRAKVACSGAFVLIMALSSASAQKVSTVAGGFVGDGGSAAKAAFQLPVGVVQDRSGNTYVTDEGQQRIRKITSAGTISTYAGTGIAGFSGDGGPAASAQISSPVSMTLDPAGNIVFTDAGNNRVRKITTTGIISTIAGNGTAGYSGDGGPATDASMNTPWDVAYDSSGNLYISDRSNNVVRKVDTSGIISTYAGNGTVGFCGDGGLATQACLNFPRGLAFDARNTLYVADGMNHRVRAVNAATGIINTVAGNGQSGLSGDGGQATAAAIAGPKNLAVKGTTLFISNAGQSRIRNVNLTTGIINTYIGSTLGYDGDKHTPLNTLTDVTDAMVPLANNGMIFVDSWNDRIRRLGGGIVNTIAGGYIGDNGSATSAAMVFPQSVAFDKSGNMYITEFSGNRVRKVSSTGVITTFAGTGISGYSGDFGSAKLAQLYFPQDAIPDAAGNVFITDQWNNVIRKVDVSGKITTFSTDPQFGGGLGYMAFDPLGNLYVTDVGACMVWKLDANGNATGIAGVPFVCGYNGDGIGATSAQLNSPYGIAFDPSGNLYIGDSGNNRIRKVSTTGVITTFAGDGTMCALSTNSCGDGGKATQAQFNFPLGIAIAKGILYIADEGDLRIRKVANGVINTVGGTGNGGYNGNNLPALSTNLDDPIDVGVNPVNGVLYLADDVQSRVRAVH